MLRTADDVARVMGDMKGVTMKLGQIVSLMGGAAVSEAFAERMATLQASAPPMAPELVRQVFMEDFGQPPERIFHRFEAMPFAAASIGQVHRARLADGREVAVKVQYPGVERALRADLRNAGLVGSFKVPFLRTTEGDTRTWLDGIMGELRARFLEEVDYVHEADMQERFRGLFAGDPCIRIPAVHRDCSARRVLTTDLVRGRTLDEVAGGEPRDVLSRYGVALHRFLMDSLHVHRMLYGDPHPGNYLFPDDGTLVVLDFGCVKEVPDWMGEAMAGYLGAAIRATRTGDRADWEDFDARVAAALRLDRADERTWPLYREFILYLLRPWLADAPFEFTPEYAGGSVDLVIRGMRETTFARGLLPHFPVLPAIPPDFAFVNRLQWGFYSVMARLRASHVWQRDLPAHIREGPPRAPA